MMKDDLRGNILFTDDEVQWEGCKQRCIETLEFGKLKHFVCHTNDRLVGKPQAICQTLQKLGLVYIIENQEEDGSISRDIKFFNERFDKRFIKGEIRHIITQEFFLYRIVDEHKREYVVFSQEELGNSQYILKGMKVSVSSATEITRTLKFSGFSSVFICYEAIPAVNIIASNMALIDKAKSLNMDINCIGQWLFTHPSGRVFKFPENYVKLRLIQLFSSKYEKYPLHLFEMGPAGTGKTMVQECLDSKFEEASGILEAANSKPKALIPSFKEKPANPGYILSCNRVALIDELLKMVEAAAGGTRQEESVQNMLSQLNMLLEHKKRTIGSGNDNFFKAEATAKVIITTNPYGTKDNLSQHVGIIDKTTLSRFLIYIQDQDYQKFVLNEKNSGNIVQYNVSKTQTTITTTTTTDITYPCITTITNNIFLTLYDSCQVFLSIYDAERVASIFKDVCSTIIDPVLKEIWQARGLHHTILILDGIVKIRRLFGDGKGTFIADEEDYNELIKMLIWLMHSWDTQFSGHYGGTLRV